jgi:hypothetical protein
MYGSRSADFHLLALPICAVDPAGKGRQNSMAHFTSFGVRTIRGIRVAQRGANPLRALQNAENGCRPLVVTSVPDIPLRLWPDSRK